MATTTKSSNVRSFLNAVAEQKTGFRLGEPERVTPDSLAVTVPILRETSLKRQYVLLSETEDVAIIDTGSVNRLRFKNKGKENVFVRAGTIFRGSTQERTLTRSTILFGDTDIELDVRCVHQTRGIQRGSQVKASGFVPLDVDNKNYGAGFAPAAQHVYWSNVQAYCSTVKPQRTRAEQVPSRTWGAGAHAETERDAHLAQMHMAKLGGKQVTTTPPPSVFWHAGAADASTVYGSSGGSAGVLRGVMDPCSFEPEAPFTAQDLRGGSDDLASTVDEVATNLDDLLSRVKRHENQVGLALITEKGLQCIELFDVSDSWSAIHKDAVARVGSNLAAKDTEQTFEFKPRAALNTVSAVLSQEFKTNLIFEHRPSNGEPEIRIFGLTGDKFIGEVVELDGRVMHASLMRTVA